MDDGGDSMDFTPRMQQILQRLLSEENFVSEQALADDLGISKRTVQRNSTGRPVPWLPTACNYSARKKPALNSSGRQTGKKN